MDTACLAVPNFVVALARRDDPSLEGRPVVIGGGPEEHAQVAACSREARAAGVEVGTTLRRALALCHDAVFLPLQGTLAAAEAAKLTALVQSSSPAVEVIAPGHVHFEAGGLARMAGMEDEEWLAALHAAACQESGLPIRLAAAETVFAAHAAAASLRSEDGTAPAPVIVPPGVSREFLAHLPVEVLPVPPLMHQRLRLFGLARLGDVAALSLSALQAQFGRDGARAWSLSRGHDRSRVTPAREDLVVTEIADLPAPTALSEPLVVGTRALLHRALGRKELRDASLRRLDWRLDLESGEQVLRRITFREPTSDPARMLFVVRGKIERLQLPAAAIALRITLSGLCSEYGHQSNLWPIGPRRWRELIDAVEQLNTRTGGPQVFRIVEVQPWSRIPERQLGLVAFGP